MKTKTLLLVTAIVLIACNRNESNPIPDCDITGTWISEQGDTVTFTEDSLYYNDYVYIYKQSIFNDHQYLSISCVDSKRDIDYLNRTFEQFTDFGPDCNTFIPDQVNYYDNNSINIFRRKLKYIRYKKD